VSLRIVLADDHPIVLDGLERLFASEEGIEVVARCVDGDEAVAAVLEVRPAVLVLDLRMPAKDGLAVLRRLREKRCDTAVVVLTAGLHERDMVEAVRLGAKGIVLKESAADEIVRCVRVVAAGGTHLRQPFLDEALACAAMAPADAELTDRELEIVRLLGRGLRNREIGNRLHITEGTVKVHLHRIYEKLGIDGRLALLRWAEDRDLI
jgi:DNA-binding NarL/FixJ family response regulator